jgi:hypothetical protein
MLPIDTVQFTSLRLRTDFHEVNRVTKWVCEKIAQNVAQPTFVKINTQLEPLQKVAQKFVVLMDYFNAHMK